MFKTQMQHRRQGPNPDHTLQYLIVKDYFKRPSAVPCDHLLCMWPGNNHRMQACHDALQKVLPGLRTLSTMVKERKCFESCRTLKILRRRLPRDKSSLLIALMVPDIIGYTREIIPAKMLSMPKEFSERAWLELNPGLDTPLLLIVWHPRASDALDVIKQLDHPPSRIFLQTPKQSQLLEIR